MQRFLARLTALSALSLGLALAGAANNSLIIGASQEPANILDPWRSNNLGIATEINDFMTARLTYLDNNGNMQTEIATRVPTLANGDYKLTKDASGKVIRNSVTYTIRKEAKWSDGAPITPKDFAFWLRVVQDERVPVPTRNPWSDAKITIQDADTFTITYDPPYLFADKTNPSLAPAHIMEKAYNAFDTAAAKMDAAKAGDAWKAFINQFTTVNSMPKVASGAFKPGTWRVGNRFTMLRNPNYWRKPPGGEDKYVQTVQYRFIPNTNTLKVNVLSGQVDALSTVGLTLDQALALEKSQRNKYKVFYFSAGTFEQISVANMGERSKSLGLQDKRVKQALLYSIDRAALTKALFGGKQIPINTWVNPYSSLYKKDVRVYNYDPAKAKALFAEAGWKPGSDGTLEQGGKKMILNYTTTAGNTVRERVQQILQAQWKAVGVQVNIQNFPASVVFGNDFAKHADDGKWDMFMFAWGSDAILEDGTLFATSEIPSKDNGYTGSNYEKYSNPAYDALWKQSMVEFDSAARAKLYDKMQVIWNEDLPMLPLYSRMDSYTRLVGLVNYDFNGSSLTPAWNAYQIGWASRGAVEQK